MDILPCIDIFRVNTLLWDAGAAIVLNSPTHPPRVLVLSTSCRLAPASWDPRQALRPVTGLERIILYFQILVLPPGPRRHCPCPLCWVCRFEWLSSLQLSPFSPLELFAVLPCSVSPRQGLGCELPCTVGKPWARVFRACSCAHVCTVYITGVYRMSFGSSGLVIGLFCNASCRGIARFLCNKQSTAGWWWRVVSRIIV